MPLQKQMYLKRINEEWNKAKLNDKALIILAGHRKTEILKIKKMWKIYLQAVQRPKVA